MPEDNLKDLRSKYEDAVVGEIGRLATAVQTLSGQVGEIKIGLAQVNLTELKADVRSVKDELLRHNLPDIKTKVDTLSKFDLTKMEDMVEKHDKQITRAVAILVFIQIAIGILFTVLKYFG
jgi:transcriptional regulator of heat shock response